MWVWIMIWTSYQANLMLQVCVDPPVASMSLIVLLLGFGKNMSLCVFNRALSESVQEQHSVFGRFFVRGWELPDLQQVKYKLLKINRSTIPKKAKLLFEFSQCEELSNDLQYIY